MYAYGLWCGCFGCGGPKGERLRVAALLVSGLNLALGLQLRKDFFYTFFFVLQLQYIYTLTDMRAARENRFGQCIKICSTYLSHFYTIMQNMKIELPCLLSLPAARYPLPF